MAARRVEAGLATVLHEIGIDLKPISGEVPDDRATLTQALDFLDQIPVERKRPCGRNRADWPHGLDTDGDGVDARHEVPAAESLVPATWRAEGCRVAGGLWAGVCTGEAPNDPGNLDVDHFVPLAEAHRSGGHAWSPERRAAFADGLGDRRGLIAVSASANRSKGDQGPEEWLPPEEADRYAANWVPMKARWDLSMDERERITGSNLLRSYVRT